MELKERAKILAEWIIANPDLLVRSEMLVKGLLIELVTAYRMGMEECDVVLARTGS